jgi:hypothetical protein
VARDAFNPSVDDLNSFAAGTLIMSTAFIAFYGDLSIDSMVFFTAVSAAILFARELGQRTIAQWMEAQVDLEISMEGSLITVFGAAASFLSSLPIILIFPVFNEHDVESYEHWGKSIDAMWIKRQYWIVSGGIMTLFATWIIFNTLNLTMAAESVSMFLIFQLLPFDYSRIPTGPLDGSIIIRWSGWIWLIFMGTALISLLLV